MLPALLVVVAIVGVLLVVGAARPARLRHAPPSSCRRSSFSSSATGTLRSSPTDSPIAGRPLQGLWLLLGAGALFLAWRGGRALRMATQALNAIGAGLLIVALVTIVPHEVGEATATASGPEATAEPLPSVSPSGKPLRDIWVLVFDRYGSAESLRLNYGIEEKLTPWLAEHGFHVTPDAHANYSRTRLSLASSLNLDYLDALRGRPVAELLHDHAVGRFLTDVGYRYIHIGSRYEPTRTAASAHGQSQSREHERLRDRAVRQLPRPGDPRADRGDEHGSPAAAAGELGSLRP